MSDDSRELSAIHERYARRTQSYEPWEPWVWKTRQELERAVIVVLRRRGLLPARDARLLEVGCGGGANLQMFLKLGFRPDRLAGVELQQDRAEAARRVLPAGVDIATGDAAGAPFADASFDVVFQSLVFTSILDDGLQSRLAARMRALVKPGGGILWYDFVYDNPSNPDVRGVPLARVRALFPGASIEWRRVTLAPPISRRVTRIWPPLYDACSAVPLLRSHVLCWIHGFADGGRPHSELR